MGDVMIDGKTTGKQKIVMFSFLFLTHGILFSTILLTSILTLAYLFQDFVPVAVQQLLILEPLC